MHAVARLTLQQALPNIQASWVKMGPERAAALMQAGCNDMGALNSSLCMCVRLVLSLTLIHLGAVLSRDLSASNWCASKSAVLCMR